MFSAGAGVFFPEPEFFLPEPEPEPEVKNPEFAQHYCRGWKDTTLGRNIRFLWDMIWAQIN